MPHNVWNEYQDIAKSGPEADLAKMHFFVILVPVTAQDLKVAYQGADLSPLGGKAVLTGMQRAKNHNCTAKMTSILTGFMKHLENSLAQVYLKFWAFNLNMDDAVLHCYIVQGIFPMTCFLSGVYQVQHLL